MVEYKINLQGWFPNLVKKWKPRGIDSDEAFLRAVIEGYLIDKDIEEQHDLADLGINQKPLQHFTTKVQQP